MNFTKILYLILCLIIFGSSFAPVIAEVITPDKASVVERQEADPENGRGFVPPPFSLSHLDGSQGRSQFTILDTPARLDWRETSDVSPIKNQTTCGACYAFASLANIESRILIDDDVTYDFSENNAKECNFYESGCGGGNFYKMANFFSKLGTVLETCDPYYAGDTTCYSSCPYIKTVLDWRVISGDAVPATADLKSYIQANGPVYTSIYAGDGNDPSWTTEFSSYDGSYTLYYTGTYATNHAVLIVGWDDTLTHAGGQGAWIVKNSWGTSWGGTCGYGAEAGYFTIAYGSAYIGKWSSYVNSLQDYDDNGDLYYHDEGGWNTSWGYGSATIVYALSKFTPTENTYLKRVELWTNDVTTDIDIDIYDDFDGTSLTNLLGSQANSSFTEAGYHSIALTTPISLSNGNAVYVKVAITNATEAYPLVADDQGTIETATTYMSNNGADGTWYDLGVNQSNDSGIRIRTSTTLGVDDDLVAIPTNTLILRNYPNPFNQSTTIEYGLPQASYVKLAVYDVLGRQVDILAEGYRAAGFHRANWNSNGKPTGYYFYKIQTDDSEKIGKMLLLK